VNAAETDPALRILVVDDEPAIRDAVGYALRSEGYDVEALGTGEEALDAIDGEPPPDLVVLDLMLPGLSGVEVCRRARAASDVPIILLTARDAEVDRVMGLEVGADDYVTKPFSMAELVSRVRALLRRRELDRSAGRAVVRAGTLELDLTRHEVQVDGRQVRLTPSEFKVLTLLAEQPDRVFTRREIMQHLWESDYVGDQRACDIHVSNIRRKIEDDAALPARLVTVRGVGYKLLAV
jgi:two-component system response regulator RegX3